MHEELDSEDQIKIEELLCDLKQLRENTCFGCGTRICGHEALMSLTMGFKDEPRCWSCLAGALEFGKEALRDHIFAYIRHRSCHYEGWRWASREEGFDPESFPLCLWPDPGVKHCVQESTPPSAGKELPPPSSNSVFDAEWDAGDMGCGDLVLELRHRISKLNPGQIFKLTATNSGAPEDLPAWCRLTGNTLVSFQPPLYCIKRKQQ